MMQTLESGNDFWSILSDRPFEDLQAEPELRDRVAQTVFFHPNPMVRRVITIGTPHRGSHFANDYTRFLARKLINLPSKMLWVTQQLTMENPGLFRDTDLLTISTSIDSLAPDSPVLPTMLAAQRPPWTRYHNIVGVVEPEWYAPRLPPRAMESFPMKAHTGRISPRKSLWRPIMFPCTPTRVPSWKCGGSC